jgi:chromosome segregation ATPase
MNPTSHASASRALRSLKDDLSAIADTTQTTLLQVRNNERLIASALLALSEIERAHLTYALETRDSNRALMNALEELEAAKKRISNLTAKVKELAAADAPKITQIHAQAGRILEVKAPSFAEADVAPPVDGLKYVDIFYLMNSVGTIERPASRKRVLTMVMTGVLPAVAARAGKTKPRMLWLKTAVDSAIIEWRAKEGTKR